MKYILRPDYRLRGWTDHPACLEHFPSRAITDLSVREYGLLSKCDGETEIDSEKYAGETARFIQSGVIRKADGTAPDPVQKYHFYENLRFRKFDLSITGFCDFRYQCIACIHLRSQRIAQYSF